MEEQTQTLSKKGIKWTLVIIVAVLAFGFVGYFYTTSIQEKNQIEKEKTISNERIKMEELHQSQNIANQKLEQDKKEFAAKSKSECMAIYKTEGAKWNNVNGWRYAEMGDKCYIQYKDPAPKSKAECDTKFPLETEDGKGALYNLMDNLLCKDGNFETLF